MKYVTECNTEGNPSFDGHQTPCAPVASNFTVAGVETKMRLSAPRTAIVCGVTVYK